MKNNIGFDLDEEKLRIHPSTCDWSYIDDNDYVKELLARLLVLGGTYAKSDIKDSVYIHIPTVQYDVAVLLKYNPKSQKVKFGLEKADIWQIHRSRYKELLSNIRK